MTPAELLRRIKGKTSLKDMFMYTPFSGSAARKDEAEQAGLLKGTGMKFKTLMTGWRALTRVGDDALLMVSGHGSSSKTTLALEGPKGWKSMTANELAERIEKDGLSKKHQSILLLSCWGGGKSNFSDPGVTPGLDRKVLASHVDVHDNSAGKCLAATLASALGKRGYMSILVGGFPGAFGPNDKGVGSVFDTQNDQPVLAQLDHIQWFDASGRAA